jgi:PAP2 superfamily
VVHAGIVGEYARAVRGLASRRDGLRQAAVVLGAVGAYEAMRLALRPDWPLALDHARLIAGWERAADVAWEAPLQHAVLRAPLLVQALNAFYLGGHFLVTGLFFVWLYRRNLAGFRVFRNGFLAATAISLAMAWLFPTAPPRVAGLGLADTLRRFGGIDIGSPGSAGLSDPVAAVPSLHAGWAFGVAAGILIYARSRSARTLAPLYPAVVVVTILATGNHFVLDAAAGALVMALGFMVIRFRLRRGVEQPGSSPGS